MFQIQGTIKVKKDVQVISEKYKKREFVITTDEAYPQHIPLALSQDRCYMLDAYNVGDVVKVSFSLRGNEWIPKDGKPTRYFLEASAFRIDAVQISREPAKQEENHIPESGPDSDLPF